MFIPFEGRVLQRPDAQLDFPQVMHAWVRTSLREPVWIQLNHFMRRIIDGFKNCFSFHKWQFE